MVEGCPIDPHADTIEFERFSAGLVRRQLGLDHELTEDEERIAEASEAALGDALR